MRRSELDFGDECGDHRIVDKNPAAQDGDGSQAQPVDDRVKEARRFLALMVKFAASYSAELKAKRERLECIIEDSHWLSVGNYKESMVRAQLRERLPKRFTVGTGFVVADGKKSRQMDVLVWDSSHHSPIFSDGEFVVIPPEACRAVVEVKGNLTHEELGDAFRNLDSVTQFAPYLQPQQAIFKALFAFDVDTVVKFPATVLNSLYAFYEARSALSVVERLKLSNRTGMSESFHWIDCIAVLGSGLVSLVARDANAAVYQAVSTGTNALEDTWGFMERALLITLLTDGVPALLRHYHSGAASHLLVRSAVSGEHSVMLVPDSATWPKSASSSGLVEERDRYRPRRPTQKKATKSAAEVLNKAILKAMEDPAFAELADEEKDEYIRSFKALLPKVVGEE